MKEKILENIHENLDESERHHYQRKSVQQKKPKYIAQLLLNFNATEGNKRLNELISDLEYFRKIYRQNFEKIKIESQKDLSSLYTTKLLIYHSLEKNMIEISTLSNKEMRTNEINKLYLWYKEKLKKIEDLRKINMKSYREVDEIPDDDIKEWVENKSPEEEEEVEEEEEKDKIKNEQKVKKIIAHRSNELFDKKMLNEYQRKILSKSLREKMFRNQNSEPGETGQYNTTRSNAELIKTLTSLKNQEFSGGGSYSTFYSYKFGTNTASLGKFHPTENEFNIYRDIAKGGDHEISFFPNYNKSTKLYFPPLSRETKFSYSYNRPEYNFENMIYENNILKTKMKLQAEKRSQEEIKTQIEKIGMMRAKYKEGINNKYEIKKVIDMYVRTNEFSSPLLQKYKLQPSKSMNDIHESSRNIKRNNLYKEMSVGNQESNIGVSQINKDNLNELIKETDNIKEIQNIVPISPNNGEVKNKVRLSNAKKIKKDKKIISGLLQKIKIDSVKNIENKKILEPLKFKKVKIRLNANKEKVQNTIFNNIKKQQEKTPSEIVSKLMSTDSLFQTNKSYQNICNINRKEKVIGLNNNNKDNNDDNDSKEEDESFYHNFCLSLYDRGNLNKINNQNRHQINSVKSFKTKREGSKIIFEQLHQTYDLNKNDYLNLRKTVSDWKKGEYLNLIDRLKRNKTPKKEKEKEKEKKNEENKKKNLRKQHSLLNAIINPKDKFDYSQYFLPRMGTLLLKRSEEPKTKKKGGK